MSDEKRTPGEGAAAHLGRSFLLGSAYVGMGSWATSGFRFVVNLGIARVLGPEPLGFYAFVFAVNEFINIIGAFSLGLALIQAPRSSQRHEDTAFAISALLGVIGLFGAAAAAPILYVYRSGEAALFILALGGARVITLLSRVPIARLERSLRYRQVAIINLAAGVIPGVCALLLAVLGAGVWSLLTRDLLIAVMLLGLAIPLSSFRYRRGFDREIASDLMAFARPVFASRALEVILQRLDRLVVGAFMGDFTLGLYHQARVLGETGFIVMNPINRVIFNLYARVQGDVMRMARVFGLVNYFLVRLVFAGAVVIIAFPGPIIVLLLGERWVAAAPLLSALGLYAGLVPILENFKQLLYGRGEVRKSVVIRLLQLLMLGIGLVVAVSANEIRFVTASLTAMTVLGLALGLYYSRDVVSGMLLESFLVPSLALAVSVATLRAQPLTAFLTSVPSPLLPLLALLVFAGIVLLLEGRDLFRKVAMLCSILRPASPRVGAAAGGGGSEGQG